MRRKTKLVVGVVSSLALFVVLSVTTMGFTTEYVTPTQLADDDGYDGEHVKLEGRALNVTEDGGLITFAVVDRNSSVDVVYDGGMPETLSDGRQVVAEGVYDGGGNGTGTVDAKDLVVRAHEGEHPENYSMDGDRYGYEGNYSG